MQRPIPCLLLAGCTHAASPCPACPCPTIEPIRSAATHDPAPGPPEEAVEAVDPKTDARVLASLFPNHLTSLRSCRKPETEPKTWVEVDDLYLGNLDDGEFVPVIERRGRTHAEPFDEIRYVVRLENCQANTGGPIRVEALFSEWSLLPGSPAEWRRPRPFLVREWEGADAPAAWPRR
jgi:hypothetical protein